MTFQILNIVIYNYSGEMRHIALKPNRVNIITGQSGSGKSALIHIVDYCLGRDECNVFHGVIRKNVSWYGLRILTSAGELFVARRNPAPGKESSEDIYIERGTTLHIPLATALVKNANLKTLADLLGEILGIADYAHEPKTGQTRKTGIADIGKALFFCFQEQTEVDSQKFLFHRQGESFIPQSIKDYLPYFLGVIDRDYIQGQEQLRTLRRKLKQREAKIAELERLRGKNFERAHAMINEAKSVGLLAEATPLPESWSEVRNAIEEALKFELEKGASYPSDSVLNDLLDRQEIIRADYRKATAEIRALRDLKKTAHGFGTEAAEQKARLESIRLYNTHGDSPSCPLCSSQLSTPPPTVEAINSSLVKLKRQLEAVNNDTPHLDRLISQAETGLEDLKTSLNETRASIESIQKTNSQLAKIRDENSRQALVKGRLSLFIEYMPVDGGDAPEGRKEAEELAAQIAQLEKELDDDTLAERLASVLALLAEQITRMARGLAIEHSESPMRLDPKKLTIIADTEDGPLPLSKMGSAETWVSLHLISHLALHAWFHKKKRPVPGFLFFDQPTQAYFPPDTTAETVRSATAVVNTDRQAVAKMFKLIEAETWGFQVVITEHADIKEDWYQDMIVENWWDDTKLVPEAWIKDR